MRSGYRDYWRRQAALFSCLALVAAISYSTTAQAQLSSNLTLTPGPSAGVRFNNTFIVYAKNPTNSLVQYRTTDGTGAPSNSWTLLPMITTDSYPAAAPICNASLTPIQIAVFVRRNTDGHLMVSRTSNLSSYTAWADTGFVTDGAPSAVWFKPTPTTGGLLLFYRDMSTQNLRYRVSQDGITWAGGAFLDGLDFGNPVHSAPTAVIRPTLNNTTNPYTLHVFFKTEGNAIRTRSTTNLSTWVATTGGDRYASKTVAYPVINSARRNDPVLTSAVGSCIIEGDPTSWLSYHIPSVTTMRASVMKFHMVYDNQWPNDRPPTFWIDYSQIEDCINAGATTIVLRTGETNYDADDIMHFMNTMVFNDFDIHLNSLPGRFPNVEWVIEVGNEPDHAVAGTTAAQARTNALAAIAAVKALPASSPLKKFRWIISLPTAWPRGTPGGQFNYTYLNDFVTAVGGKSVLTEYDGVGVHIYTNNNLAWNNTGERPLTVLEYALARLPYGKMVHVSEIGLNSRTVDWGTKGLSYKNAMYAAPACVCAWEIFCTSAHAQWNTNTHYCMDKIYTDKQVTAVTAGTGANVNYTQITFNNSTPTFPVVNDTVSTYPEVLPAGTWSINMPTAVNHVHFGTDPNNPTHVVEGVWNILGTNVFPKPGPGFFWINTTTGGFGPYIVNSGWTDHYPLWSVGAPSRAPAIGTLPCAHAIGGR